MTATRTRIVTILPAVLLSLARWADAQPSAAGGIYLHQLQKRSWSAAQAGQTSPKMGIQQPQVKKLGDGTVPGSLLCGRFSPLGAYRTTAATKPKPKTVVKTTPKPKTAESASKRSLCRLILSGLGRAFTPLWNGSRHADGVDPLELEDICREIDPLTVEQPRIFTSDLVPPPSLGSRILRRPQ